MNLTPICKQLVERAEQMRLKGKKRDEMAMEFIVGAATALEGAGHSEDAQHLAKFASFLVSFRGFAAIKEMADKQ